jgi:deoxyribose-phosphate aldolase
MTPSDPAASPWELPEIAPIIDHSLLRPELDIECVVEELNLAKRYGVASVTVRPCDIDLAVRTLDGSKVKPGSVCSYPFGWQSTATKLYETRDLLRRGAREIDMVVAASRLLSREFQNVQSELSQMAETCRKEGAILKLILETTCLTDELKIIACRCAERAEVHFVVGHTLDDVKLFRKYLPEQIGIKAMAELATLDHVLGVCQSGATRIGTASTAAILDEWRARSKPPETAP